MAAAILGDHFVSMAASRQKEACVHCGRTKKGEHQDLSGGHAYGIHTFDWAARAKPAAIAANCAHPARMVLGPGGLYIPFTPGSENPWAR